MTRRAAALGLGVLAAFAAVAIAGVLAWRGGGGDVEPGEQALAVRRWVQPESQLFGDPVVATIDVVADSERVDVDSVAVETSFAPYDVVGEPRRSRAVDGPLVRLRTQYRLQCLAQVCVPEATELPLTLAPAKVTYLRADGSPGPPRTVPWPRLTIASQLEGGVLPQGTPDPAVPAPPVRARVQPPDEPSWRLSPTVAQAALLGGAAALVAVAALLLLPLVRRRPQEPAPEPAFTVELTPLERALVGLDWAREAGASREQRKALELLAEELDADEEDLTTLADDARVLAWSARPPGDESTATLSRRVREIVEGRAAALADAAAAEAAADDALAGAPGGNGRRA